MLLPIVSMAESITLGQALQKTTENNLLLLQYPFFQQQAVAELKQAKIRPQPTLQLEVENILGRHQLEGIDGAETTLMLSQLIELGDKRRARIDFATAEAKQRAAAFELTRLKVLAETSRRFYALLSHDAFATLLDKRIKQEKAAFRLIQQRAKAGAVSDVDVKKMALHLEKSLVQQLALTQQRQLLKMALSSQWLAYPAFDQVKGNLLALPILPSIEQVQQAVEQSPEYLLKHAQMLVASGQSQLAQRQGKADFRLGGGVKYLNEEDSFALTLRASMPLHLSNPNAGRIEAANAQYRLSQQQFAASEKRLALELHQLHRQTLLLKSEIDWITKRLLPQAKSLLAASQSALAKGQITVLQWADSEDEVFALEEALIRKHTQIYNHLLTIEQITGVSLGVDIRAIPRQTGENR
ncbi:MAG: TolC family protein [Cellvibrionales bacterium]|nr:TolC family protein [Cellvibrionales bacterium]